LINLELPQWRLRRIAYDGGEWYRALSRQPELPESLDDPVHANHSELPLAMLIALVNARRMTGSSGKPSVPSVP
jgi:hypothetical protein